MAIDEQHVALPKLYGAPAYARPPRPSAEAPKPFDPDDLPIEAVRSDEERELLESLPADGYFVSCFPHKIRGASAGWTRAVAIFDEALMARA